MKQLTAIESRLIFIFALLVPVYPAISIMHMRHGEISFIKLAFLCTIVSFIINQFFKYGRNLKMYPNLKDIKDYLNAHYTDEQQTEIITNYRNYKSNFWVKWPMFSSAALQNDPNLKAYNISVLKLIFKILSMTVALGLAIILMFFIFAWY